MSDNEYGLVTIGCCETCGGDVYDGDEAGGHAIYRDRAGWIHRECQSPEPEPTCIVCGRTQAQVEASEPGPHFRMRHGKCEDCSSGSDYRTCLLPNCTDYHEREVMARCEDCGCVVATGDGIIVEPVLCWVCRANRSQPEPEPEPERREIDSLTRQEIFRCERDIARDLHATDNVEIVVGFTRCREAGWRVSKHGASLMASPLLALPAATGTPTERRATLEAAFDSNAERLAYNYGAMRVDPACSSILENLNTAIADDWRENTAARLAEFDLESWSVRSILSAA